MKPLVIGASGQVGRCLAARAVTLGRPLAQADRTALDLSQCAQDTTGFQSRLEQLILTHQPSHLILAAAYTAVDKAEAEPELAYAVNGLAPAIIGAVAAAHGLPVVHYSTDYVFSGTKPGSESYAPDDAVDPQSVYGKTKAQGEQGLLQSGAECLIFRTSWVFSAHGGNFLKTMLRLAQERDQLRVVADQVGAPTSAEWLAEASLNICENWPMNGLYTDAAKPARGIYHLTAEGSVSWHGFALALLEEARTYAPNRPWTITASKQVEAITTEQFNAPAPRPRNSQLDCSTTERTFQMKRPAWQDQMRAVLKTLLKDEA